MEINEQLAIAERELRRRKKHYPRLVEQRQLTPATAQNEIDGMASIVKTLGQYKKMTTWMKAVEELPEAAEFSRKLTDGSEPPFPARQNSTV